MQNINTLVIVNSIDSQYDETITNGLNLANKAVEHGIRSTTHFPFRFIYNMIKSCVQFQYQVVENEMIGKSGCCRAEEIIEIANQEEKRQGKDFNLVFLIYSSKDQFGDKPCNPVQLPVNTNGYTIIQVPLEWFTTNPDVLRDYFLHEVSHALYFMANVKANAGIQDPTHANMYKHQTRLDSYLENIRLARAYWWTISDTGQSVKYPVLKLGSKGQSVKTLQRLLKENGYWKLPYMSTTFGSYTDKMVRKVQSDTGLFVDGIVGQMTWYTLVS